MEVGGEDEAESCFSPGIEQLQGDASARRKMSSSNERDTRKLLSPTKVVLGRRNERAFKRRHAREERIPVLLLDIPRNYVPVYKSERFRNGNRNGNRNGSRNGNRN